MNLIFSLNVISFLLISKSFKKLDLLIGIVFLLSKLKISKAVNIDHLVLILLKLASKTLFLLGLYSTSIIPPSMGYKDELT